MVSTSGGFFTPEDITRIQWIGEPLVSPDGSMVVFTVTHVNEVRDENISAIWMVGTNGSDPRQFTSGFRRDHSPRWSPDGSRIAFVSERHCPDLTGPAADKTQLYVMDMAGGEPVRLTSCPGGVSSPEWSPDGGAIAFVARVDRDGAPGDVGKPVVSGDRPPSHPARVIETLRYRRNGEGFIDSRRQICVVWVASDRQSLNTGQSAVIQLTHGDFDHTDPAWTPDGKQLLFVCARHAARDVDNCSDIWVMDVGDLTETSSTPERPFSKVTSTTGPLAMPVPSPDGTHVMYFGHAHPVDTGRQTRAWVQPIGAEPKVPHNASGHIDRNVVASSQMRPAWLAGTERVVFAAEDDGATVITSAPAGINESSTQRTAGNRQDIVSGTRDVSGFNVAGDGTRIVFVASDATTPPELFVTELGDGGNWHERQLTNLNAHWCRRTKRVEPIRHMITRDGHGVVYWVMLPASDEGETPSMVPALVNIHGGPHAQYGDRFFDEFLVYAGAGYAVIYANPRGSMGSTEAFSRAVIGDWGGGDAADILAVVDDALSRYPLIDPSRLGIMGGSYGGYLTSSIVTQTDRFVAACSERALNSFASFSGTSDIGFWFSIGELGTSPFDDADTAARHSPLTYASRITTPMLIIHSEQDLRCPIEQAEQLHVALLLAGKVSRFVRFANADHELSRTGRPRQRLERFRHILDWFEPYLRPKGR